jgi:thiol:disulfide interchange protein DsbD
VRDLLAFPMFAAAAWLAWVLAQQGGAMSVLALLTVATALAFALVVARWSRAWLTAGLIVLAACSVWAWRPLTAPTAPAAETAATWSEARVEQLRRAGQPVFVNFTAAWCLTCKVNEATTLSSPRVRAAFRARGVTYLVGDWTNRSDAVEAALAAHGRAGVPLYLYYPPGQAEPVALPQILSERTVLDAIGAQ